MKLFKFMAVFSFLNVLMVFYISFMGLDDIFPQTYAKTKELFSAFDQQLAQKTTPQSNAVQIVVDLISNIAAGMITIFRLVIEMPFIVITFIDELFTALALPFSPVLSALFTWIFLLGTLYYFLVVIEWIKTGFTRTT